MTARKITLTQQEFAVEQGLMWLAGHSTNINGGDTYYYGFTTAAYWVLLTDRYFQTGSTDSSFSLYRDTSYTGGTDLTIYNRNDNYAANTSKSPVTAIKYGVTATPQAADLVVQVVLDSKTSLEREIGAQAAVNLFLKPNTDYVLAVNNVTGASTLHRWSVNAVQWSLINTNWKPVKAV